MYYNKEETTKYNSNNNNSDPVTYLNYESIKHIDIHWGKLPTLQKEFDKFKEYVKVHRNKTGKS